MIFHCYPTNAKGYRFYCPTGGTTIVESINAKFLENGFNDLIDHQNNEPNSCGVSFGANTNYTREGRESILFLKGRGSNR